MREAPVPSMVSSYFLRLRDLCDPDFARSKLSYRGRRSRRLCKMLTFPLQEYWSGLPFPSLRDLPDQGSNLCLLPLSPALAGGFFTTSATWEDPR